MKREEAEERARIMLEFAKGRTIKIRKIGERPWYLSDSPAFNWAANEYEVAERTDEVVLKELREEYEQTKRNFQHLRSNLSFLEVVTISKKFYKLVVELLEKGQDPL